jgi:multiple sugar transport system permease protein
MLFPFIFMFSTSFKYQKDTFRYPPRLIPHIGVNTTVEGEEEPKPLYYVNVKGSSANMSVQNKSRFMPTPIIRATSNAVSGVGRRAAYPTKNHGGWERIHAIRCDRDGQIIPMIRCARPTGASSTANPGPGNIPNVRQARRRTGESARTSEVTRLKAGRPIILSWSPYCGHRTAPVLGGYALARLRFPGRDALFVVYLGTIMIPFVVLITPLYQLMVAIVWVNKLSALIIPWIFTAYGTFLMRQFFITIPKEIEEAALIDGASRMQILYRIFVPASVPALATLATFSFLYASVASSTGHYQHWQHSEPRADPFALDPAWQSCR